MLGKSFNYWTVLELDRVTPKKKYYKCQCKCGTIRSVADHSLKKGGSKSCGCLKKENLVDPNIKRLRRIYNGMVKRCTDPSHNRYEHYGAKGICCEWTTFDEFKNDMFDSYVKHVVEHGEKNTSIERSNVKGNYTRSNCKWATILEQMNNTSTNVFYEWEGKKMTLAEICREKELPYKIIHNRINDLKWDLEKAVTVPIGEAERVKGEGHHQAKLTDNIVRNIRHDRENLKLTYDALADKYKLGRSTVCRICKYQSWTHVK
ncbi:hypothetical protein [Bacillus cereus group sp. BfR-BA-01313]|uniref:hypothetical protein n=1 Tax=Bacillus cereus group sp. BfR-BA-01313 TaxID=2920290 RepID=UPI001F592E31